MLPKTLRNYNMIIQGQGFAGRVDELGLPKLTLKVEDGRQGGMDAPESMDMGMEKVVGEFTATEHDPILFKSFGLADGSAINAIFRAGIQGDEATVVEPYVVFMRGRLVELDPGTLKVGDKMPLKGQIYCNYYRLERNNVKLIEIDVRNMVRIVNGVDQLAAMRAAIQA